MEKQRRACRFFAVGLAALFICIALMPDTYAYASRKHPPVGTTVRMSGLSCLWALPC